MCASYIAQHRRFAIYQDRLYLGRYIGLYDLGELHIQRDAKSLFLEHDIHKIGVQLISNIQLF